MVKDSLIIMPFHLPWDHSADYQRQTCLVLHKQNLVICYMHHDAQFFLKKRSQKLYPKIKNIIFYSPLYIIPFRRFEKIEKLNQLLNLFYLTLWYGVGKRVILWIFDPMFYFYPKVKLIFPWVRSLYDCVDYHWSRNPEETRLLRLQEKQLIKNVDFFFVNSQTLSKIHQSIRHPDAILPLGFALDVFKKHENDKLPSNLHLPPDRLIIGYIGALNWRLDFNLLINLISQNPQWTFTFFGPLQEDNYNLDYTVRKHIKKLLSLENVFYGGILNRNHIPGVIAQFAVCMIPYDISYDFNRYCYPLKLYEYFYMGKPVISTPIEDLKHYRKYVKISTSPQKWVVQIKEFVSKPWMLIKSRNQRIIAEKNNWDQKVNSIINRLY